MVDNNLTQCFQQFADRLTRLEKLISENFATSNHASDSDQLLTVEQAAEFLHLSVPTLYAKVCKRAIPHMKRSKRLYFSKQELKSYLNDGRNLTANQCKEVVDQLYINSKTH
jgi:excisionase family DNA binding protein